MASSRSEGSREDRVAISWERISELFEAALALPPAERTAYLKARCPEDEAARAEIESLLRFADREGPLDRLKRRPRDRAPGRSRDHE